MCYLSLSSAVSKQKKLTKYIFVLHAYWTEVFFCDWYAYKDYAYFFDGKFTFIFDIFRSCVNYVFAI